MSARTERDDFSFITTRIRSIALSAPIAPFKKDLRELSSVHPLQPSQSLIVVAMMARRRGSVVNARHLLSTADMASSRNEFCHLSYVL